MISLHLQDTKGMTLVEVAVVLGLGVLLLTSLYTFINAQSARWEAQRILSLTERRLRVAVDIISKDLRMLGYKSTTTPITAAEESRLIFESDLDLDGTAESITYDLNSTNNRLLRNSLNLLDDVESLSFTYYGKDNAALTPMPLDADNRTKVKRIEVSVAVKKTLPNNKTKTLSITTGARMRNMQ